MKKYYLILNDKEFEVNVEEIAQETAKVKVNGNIYDIHIKPEEQEVLPKVVLSRTVQPVQPVMHVNRSAQTGKILLAPMPGVITTISTQIGATVKAGDTLCRMEAMKMENDIRSSFDGVVKKISVKENETVLEGAILIELE